MMNYLKSLMLFRLMIQVNKLEKYLVNKLRNHDNDFTTQEFNKLTRENFATTLKN